MNSLKINKERVAAEEALQALKADDLRALCNMFELPVGNSRAERISHLLGMGEESYVRLVRISRLARFGSYAEEFISTRNIKEILSKQGLATSGTKHEIVINAVISDRFPITKFLDQLSATGIRKIYKHVLDKHPIDSERVLRNEVLVWLDYSLDIETLEYEELPKDPNTPGLLKKLFRSAEQPTVPINDHVDTSPPIHTQVDVAISYASEDKSTAEAIAQGMKEYGLNVFFAPYKQAQLWGKKLSDTFKETYGPNARYVLVLVSKHYTLKDFTNFEFTIARDEARKRKEEFILPVRLDDTPIIGLHSDVAYIDYGQVGPKGIARLVKQKMSATRSFSERFKSLISGSDTTGRK